MYGKVSTTILVTSSLELLVVYNPAKKCFAKYMNNAHNADTKRHKYNDVSNAIRAESPNFCPSLFETMTAQLKESPTGNLMNNPKIFKQIVNAATYSSPSNPATIAKVYPKNNNKNSSHHFF